MTDHSRDALLMSTLGLAACAVGMAAASTRGSWTDEAATIFVVGKPFAQMWGDILRHDVNPPGGYLVLWLWGLLGDGPAHLRALSAVLFGFCTALTYQLGVRLRGPLAGLFAAVFFALTPLAEFLAAQARYPMLLTALLLGASMALLDLARRGRPRDAVVWTLCATAAAYVHYFAVFVLAAHLAYVLYSWRSLPNRRLAVWAWLAVGLLYAPWVPFVVRQLIGREAAGGGEPVAFGDLMPLVLVYLTQGYSFWRLPSFWRELIAPPLSYVPLLAALPFAALTLLGAVRREPDRTGRAFLLVLALGPLAAYLVVSSVLSLFAPHYFLPFLPFLAVLAGTGWQWCWTRWKLVAAVLGLLALAATAGGALELWQHPDEPEGWRPIARAIARGAQEGDAVLLPNLAARLCYTLVKTDHLPVYHLTMLDPGQQVVTPAMIERLLPLLKNRHRRLWYVRYYPDRFDPRDAAERVASADGYFRPSAQVPEDPRVSLGLWYLHKPLTPGGVNARISFPDGPQHPAQLGAGWFPTRDEQAWIGPVADALLPSASGAPLELTATVPLTLFGGQPPTVTVTVNDQGVPVTIEPNGRVRLGPTPLLDDAPWVAVKIRCSRSFVPDEIFHDGDRSRKCMQVGSLGWGRR